MALSESMLSDGAKAGVLVVNATAKTYCFQVEESIATATEAARVRPCGPGPANGSPRTLAGDLDVQLMVEPVALRPQVEHAIEMARETEDWWVLNENLGHFGMCFWLCGDFEAARPILDEAMAEAQRVGDLDQVGCLWSVKAAEAAMQGAFAEAEGYAAEGGRICRQTGNLMWTSAGLLFRAGVLVGLGRYADAHRSLDEALAVGSEDGFSSLMIDSVRAMVALGEGDTARAVGGTCRRPWTGGLESRLGCPACTR